MFSLKTAIKKILKFNKECIGSRVETRVWTNPDPYSLINTTFISLDLSDADEVRIMFQFYKGNVTNYDSRCADITVPTQHWGSINMKSHDTGTSHTEATYLWTRIFQTTTAGIKIGECTLRISSNATYASVQPGYLIPLYVNKIKYVTPPPSVN